ncbi:MAG: hypothetical protein ACRDNT_03445 [Streptosporangiaceae bacterium]
MNTTYGTPAGGYGSDPADPSSARGFPARARKRRLFRWGAGLTLASFLAGGGIALAVVAAGSGVGAAAASPASSAASSTASSARAAELNTELNTELSAAAGNSATATFPGPRVRRALARLRLLGGVHGEFTLHNKTGFHTVAFERGAIQSASGSDVVIKAPDGTTWTWLIVSDTVVRENGAKTTTSALSAGETVFAGGPEASGAKDARLIVIRPASASSASSGPSGPSGPSGAESAQTSLS